MNRQTSCRERLPPWHVTCPTPPGSKQDPINCGHGAQYCSIPRQPGLQLYYHYYTLLLQLYKRVIICQEEVQQTRIGRNPTSCGIAGRHAAFIQMTNNSCAAPLFGQGNPYLALVLQHRQDTYAHRCLCVLQVRRAAQCGGQRNTEEE